MRVLVVRVTSMGDVVLTLPAITDMLAHVPGLEIDWLVEKPFASIARMHPGVRTVFPVSWRKWRKALWRSDTRAAFAQFRHDLRAKEYDLVLDFQGQIAKSVVLGSLARGPLCGFAWQGLREPLSSLFYRRKAQVSKRLHLVPRSRALAAILLGYAVPTSAPDYCLTGAAPNWTPEQEAGRARYALIIPHASRPEKHWPEERWVAIGQRLRREGFQVVVFWGSPAEQVLARHLAAAFGGQVPPFLTVAEAANVIAKAALVVGLDTGFTHLAAGLERPTVGIYCDFDPALAGVTGRAFTASLGGIGQYPALDAVQEALSQAIAAAQSEQSGSAQASF
jgi:heptosyltransferase I